MTASGADPGEVKWVNFHPPFSEPSSFFLFFLSLKYWNNIWFLWHYYKIHPPFQNPGSALEEVAEEEEEKQIDYEELLSDDEQI